MTSNKYTIAWEKWKDPWNKNDDSDEAKSDRWESGDIDLDELDISSEDDDETEEEGRVIITPMGAFPILNRNSPGKIFNLWIGHTNFKISEAIIDKLIDVLGVESLDVYTPYRMRIGIGKMFKPKDVMHRIDVILQKHFAHKRKN